MYRRCDALSSVSALGSSGSALVLHSPVPIGPRNGRGDAQCLATSRLTTNESNIPHRHTKRVREKAPKLLVGFALDRRRGHANLQCVAMHAGDLGPFSA